ncbi:WD40/YVTN/BNR-like repeat-containing protein [Sphingomonas sp. R86520]|uniref:WD40/YVTN/BNR-like repeat-containing protein n=1 Tax=Sphingomonas sp. R86520 TaxID=3093859 RepID=UPI0036D290FE
MRKSITAALGFAMVAISFDSSAATTGAPLYTWRTVTVGGGGFAPGIVFSTAERGLAYLRTDMGGAYRFDAKRARWVPLQDGNAIGSYMGVESIAADPVDPNIVYLAAGMSWRSEAAILRSGDRGANWSVTPVPFRMGGNEDGRGLGERLAIDPNRTSRLLFGSRHDGLWRSVDSGAHWVKLAAFPLAGLGTPTVARATHGGLSFVLFDKTHPGRVFVASADPGARHLFRSDDDGATWSAVAGGPDAAMLPVKAVLGSDGVLTISYANGIGPNGITRGAVWRYDFARALWSDVTPDKRADAPVGGYMGVAVSAQDPRVIAVSTVDRYQPVDTVWRSSDAGAHWDELYTRSTRDVAASPFLKLAGDKADFGHWIAGLAIDPFDANHAAYVTGATMYATRAFGARGAMAWKPWTAGIEQTAIITLTSPTSGAPLISGFGDIGGFRHDDLSVSPAKVHTNPYLTNTNNLDYAGMAPQVVVRSGNTHAREAAVTLAWSGDGGTSWQPIVPPTVATTAVAGRLPPEKTGDAPIVVSADGTTFIVGTGLALLTRDRGRTWSAPAGLPLETRVTADKVDARKFYAVDVGRHAVLRSDDGGANFAAVAGRGLPADLRAVRTTNREQQNPLAAVPGQAGALWLKVGSDLYRSSDAGESWSKGSDGLAVDLYGLGRAAPGSRWPTVYAIGRKGGVQAVWRSIDGGAGWQRINDERHQWGLRFRVISGDPKTYGRVYIGTDGRGIVYGDPVFAKPAFTKKD